MKKNKKLNNKGYMLVEIILASAIAFGLAYFMIDMTIKLKNKNDDLLVETLVATDKAIISNEIMRYVKANETTFSCDKIELRDLGSDRATIKINDRSVKLSKYVTVTDVTCNVDINNKLHINIPLRIEQNHDANFDVDLYYKLSDDSGIEGRI